MNNMSTASDVKKYIKVDSILKMLIYLDDLDNIDSLSGDSEVIYNKALDNALAEIIINEMNNTNYDKEYNDYDIITESPKAAIDIYKSYESGCIFEGKLYSKRYVFEHKIDHLALLAYTIDTLLNRGTIDNEEINEILLDKLVELEENYYVDLEYVERSILDKGVTSVCEKVLENVSDNLYNLVNICKIVLNHINEEDKPLNEEGASVEDNTYLNLIYERFLRKILINNLDSNKYKVWGDDEKERTYWNGNGEFKPDIIIGYKENNSIKQLIIMDAKFYIKTPQNSNSNETGGEMCKYYCGLLAAIENNCQNLKEEYIREGLFAGDCGADVLYPYWRNNIKAVLAYPLINNDSTVVNQVYNIPLTLETKIDLNNDIESIINRLVSVVDEVKNWRKENG